MILHLRDLFRNTTLILTLFLITNSARAQYCEPDYITGTGAGDYTDGVELGDISNFTGAGADWNDYTDLSTLLNPGLSYDLILYNCPSWTEYYVAWIDWDQDEIFSDDERLNDVDLVIAPGSSDIINFTVPFIALPGTTRMRVMCVYYPPLPIEACGAGGTYYYGEAEDYSIIIPAAGPYDLGVTDIEGLATDCGLGITPLTVSITNLGTEPSGSFQVAYQLTDPVLGVLPTVTETYTGAAIPSLSTIEYTFASPIDLSNLGDYYINSYTIYGVDIEPLNDSSDQSLTSIPIVNTFPYYEEFEAGAAGWIPGGALSSWELGNPAGLVIAGPPPATPGSLNSWTTSLTDYYNLNEKSYVTSPCLDFTSLVFPYLEMDINWETQLYSDGAKVQYSTDAGATWADLGNVGLGTNWYNSYNVYGMWPTFYLTDYRGWDGNSLGWRHAYQDLSFLGGESSVMIRIVFASDSYWNFHDGFAFDNVKIADLFPNDVGVASIDDPNSGPSLTAAENISVVIKNYGTLPQSGFPVSYRMDGGTIVTETFTGTVDPGLTAIHNFTTTEDLGTDGDYNFEAWTSLATDEDLANDTIIEVVSNLLPIAGTNAYYIYSNVTGYEPFYVTSNGTHMDDVFGVGNWTQDFYETIDPAVLFGTGTCFIYLEGSDAHADELELFISTNAILMENWVASGGHLFLNASPNEGDGMDFGFDGIHLNYPWYTYNADAVDPGHPIWSGPFTPTSTVMSGFYLGYATISGTDWTTILYDTYTPDRILVAEKTWGAGTVIFGSMTATDYHSPLVEAANFRKNIIAYIATCTISDNDMGVASAISPTSACGLSSDEDVIINVKNYGFLSQTNVPVSYQINAGPIITEIVPGTIDVGESVEYTFSAGANLAAIGEYNIATWTSLPLDTVNSNDTTNYVVNNVPTITSYPYYEDFEAGSGGWLEGGANSSWELGNPAGFAIIGAPPETPGSLNSWTTNLTGNYNLNEKSYITSPCMDFSSLVLPYIEFDVNYDAQLYSDGSKIQYTLDEGATWNDLGTVGDGINWYNSFNVYGMWPTFYITDYRGWEGNSGGWKHAYYDMSFLGGEPSVRFRFVFASDSYWNFNDGIAFDNMNIQDPFPNDIGVVDVITPASAVDLTGAEIVSVLIQNFGTLPQSGFDVAYTVDGGAVYTEPFVGVLPVGGTAVMTFAATEDFSADGFYAFQSWTELATDEDLTNDTLDATIVNLTPVSGTVAYYIYSNVYGGFEPWYVTTNSDAMDVVFGVDGWLLEYYETLNVFDVFNENTCFVYLEGSDAQANELENWLDINGEFVQNWVASGGNLILNSAPNEGDGMSFGFDGVEMNYAYYTSNVTAADPGHPVFNGPYTPITTDYSGGSFGHSTVEGGDIEPIIVDLYDASRYVLAEKNWGDGHVIFGGMTPAYFHSPLTEADNLVKNIYDYVKLCAPVDLGVVELITPEGGCAMGLETISIQVENFGPSSVSSFPVKYEVDGGGIVSEFASLFIDAGGTGTYTFPVSYDFSAPGDYEICVWTDISGDEDITNDMLCVTITSMETPSIEFGPNMTVCDAVVLDAGNIGNTYLWSTGETTQTINVTTTGVYSVTITNPTTGCAVTDEVTVTVNYTPAADFTYTTGGLTIIFTNGSTDGATYSWSFGDGGTSTLENPSHTYAVAGAYTVTLTVSNGCGTTYVSYVINVGTDINEYSLSDAITIHPNPTSDFANISIEFAVATEIRLELVNALGQVIWSNQNAEVITANYTIDMKNFAAGVYQLNIISGNENASKPIVLTK